MHGVVGREHELAALESFLADARGQTAVLAMHGSPGMERARGVGTNVLTHDQGDKLGRAADERL